MHGDAELAGLAARAAHFDVKERPIRELVSEGLFNLPRAEALAATTCQPCAQVRDKHRRREASGGKRKEKPRSQRAPAAPRAAGGLEPASLAPRAPRTPHADAPAKAARPAPRRSAGR